MVPKGSSHRVYLSLSVSFFLALPCSISLCHSLYYRALANDNTAVVSLLDILPLSPRRSRDDDRLAGRHLIPANREGNYPSGYPCEKKHAFILTNLATVYDEEAWLDPACYNTERAPARQSRGGYHDLMRTYHLSPCSDRELFLPAKRGCPLVFSAEKRATAHLPGDTTWARRSYSRPPPPPRASRRSGCRSCPASSSGSVLSWWPCARFVTISVCIQHAVSTSNADRLRALN